MLALAAYLVGRGTSHSFLIRRFPTLAPMAFVWFGFLAALRGSQGWDQSWGKVSKSIERQVRSSFDWADPPTADICWAEYKWLAETFSGNKALSEIVRSTPRSMSVEIIPGATFQFRTSEIAPRKEQDTKAAQRQSLEGELREALESFVALSIAAKRLLDQKGDQTSDQRGLPLGEPNTAPRSKPKRQKRS
jgi:hypothetical protein